jgi:hypothetical protein
MTDPVTPDAFDALRLSLPPTLHLDSTVSTFVVEPQFEPVMRARPAKPKPRTNVIVTRRRLGGTEGLATLAELTATELARLPGVDAPQRSDVVFGDGTPGVVFRYAFDAHGLRVRQLKCLRLDARVWTDLTITAEATTLKPAEEQALLETVLRTGMA